MHVGVWEQGPGDMIGLQQKNWLEIKKGKIKSINPNFLNPTKISVQIKLLPQYYTAFFIRLNKIENEISNEEQINTEKKFSK